MDEKPYFTWFFMNRSKVFVYCTLIIYNGECYQLNFSMPLSRWLNALIFTLSVSKNDGMPYRKRVEESRGGFVKVIQEDWERICTHTEDSLQTHWHSRRMFLVPFLSFSFLWISKTPKSATFVAFRNLTK